MKICNDCDKEFKHFEFGCKIKPIPLCKMCVIRRKPFECYGCKSIGCIKEGFYRRDCWECKAEGCTVCMPFEIKERGIEFNFCESHKNYDKKQIKLDAEAIREDEKL